MENKEKVDVIIEKLQRHQPQLQDGDELTRQIMKTIAATQRKQVPRFLSYTQTFSGIAAIFLLFFFVFQSNMQYEGKSMKAISPQPVYNTVQITSDCREILNNKEFTYRDVYLCYLQHKSEKNEKLKNIKKSFSL